MMERLRQFDRKGNPIYGDCGLPIAECAREHFCARCTWELTLSKRIPDGTGGYLHPRCVKRKKAVR